MECPKCNSKMGVVGKDFSYNFKSNPKKKYKRSVYHCKKDDIWIKVEIPSSK